MNRNLVTNLLYSLAIDLVGVITVRLVFPLHWYWLLLIGTVLFVPAILLWLRVLDAWNGRIERPLREIEERLAKSRSSSRPIAPLRENYDIEKSFLKKTVPKPSLNCFG